MSDWKSAHPDLIRSGEAQRLLSVDRKLWQHYNDTGVVSKPVMVGNVMAWDRGEIEALAQRPGYRLDR